MINNKMILNMIIKLKNDQLTLKITMVTDYYV